MLGTRKVHWKESLEATFKSWLALALLTEFPHVRNIELVLR